MASNRHLGRIIALQTLYEFEFRQDSADAMADVDEILARNLERYDEAIDDKDFVTLLVHGVRKLAAELDATIQPIAPEWPLEQIARIDRTILRMALYELLHMSEQVPPKVAINEAVELAKAFGSDNSSKFVNGVLGTAYRTLIEGKEADGNASSKV
jgi:transcription antitermination protein NusB